MPRAEHWPSPGRHVQQHQWKRQWRCGCCCRRRTLQWLANFGIAGRGRTLEWFRHAILQEVFLAQDRLAFPLARTSQLAQLHLELGDANAALPLAQAALDGRSVVLGEEDHGNPPAMARRMAELIPDARAAIVPKLRHMGLAEDPDAIARELAPFLQGSVARSTPI